MKLINYNENVVVDKNIRIQVSLAKEELIRLLPESIKSEFSDKAFIAGGCFYSLANKQIPKDFDFFVTDEDFVKKIIKEIREYMKIPEDSSMYFGCYNGLKFVLTPNAITIGKFQIITKWFGKPEEVVGQFDFHHLMFYYHNSDVETITSYRYLTSNSLVYNEKRARDIVGTIFRVNKFVSRGFTINHKEMSKILLKLDEIGFSRSELDTLKSNLSERTDGFGS